MSSFDLGRFAAPLFVPVLSSPPLVLRPFDPGDRDLVRRASLDPLVTAISSVPVACDDAAAEDFIERQHTLAAEGHGYPFAISLLNDDAVSTGIGCIGLWLRDIEHGRASVGYWLLEPARGRGLAGRALRAAAQFAFSELGIPRLHLFVEPWNVASARTALRAGFHHEARLRGWERMEGAQRDADCYALLATEWPNDPETG